MSFFQCPVPDLGLIVLAMADPGAQRIGWIFCYDFVDSLKHCHRSQNSATSAKTNETERSQGQDDERNTSRNQGTLSLDLRILNSAVDSKFKYFENLNLEIISGN